MKPSALDRHRLVDETFLSRVEHHSVLASTNDLARRRAAQSDVELPLAIVADRQTAGRGRGSHRWWTGRGSLAMSLVLEADRSGREQAVHPLLGLAAAVAVVRACEPLVPGRTLGLHWPNDVVIEGRKLSGILVEVPGSRRPIVGIGLNTNNRMADAPEALRSVATTLRDLTDRQHDHTELLIALFRHLDLLLQQLAKSPEQVAAEADDLCRQRGRLLTIRAADRVTSGRCAGIAPDGALLLETPEGLRKFHSGAIQGMA